MFYILHAFHHVVFFLLPPLIIFMRFTTSRHEHEQTCYWCWNIYLLCVQFIRVGALNPGHGRSATRCLLYRIMTKKQLAAQFQGSFSCNLHFIMSPAVWLVKKTTRWSLAGRWLVRIIETWLRSRSNWSNGDGDHANLRTLTLLPSCHT